MTFLGKHFQWLQTFKNKLYNPEVNDGPVKQAVIWKIVESSLLYQHFQNLFNQAGKEGLMAVLSKPPTTAGLS